MQFTMTVNMDNAAFHDDADELTDILNKVTADVTLSLRPPPPASTTRVTGVKANIRDSNGNTVGRWTIADN